MLARCLRGKGDQGYSTRRGYKDSQEMLGNVAYVLQCASWATPDLAPAKVWGRREWARVSARGVQPTGWNTDTGLA